MTTHDKAPKTHTDQVLAGLDLSSGPRLAGIETLGETGAKLRSAEEREYANAIQAEADYRNLSMRDAFESTVTGQVMRQWQSPSFLPDPNFTPERYEQRLKEVAEVGAIPEEYIPLLAGAKSDAHFDQLFQRAWAQIEARKRLENAGWAGTAAQMAAELLDVPGLALGIGAYGVGLKAARLARLSRARTILATEVGSGALGGASYEYARKLSGVQTDNADILMATAVGAAFGGVVSGYLIGKPALWRQAAAMDSIGRRIASRAEERVRDVASKAGITIPERSPERKLGEGTQGRAAADPAPPAPSKKDLRGFSWEELEDFGKNLSPEEGEQLRDLWARYITGSNTDSTSGMDDAMKAVKEAQPLLDKALAARVDKSKAQMLRHQRITRVQDEVSQMKARPDVIPESFPKSDKALELYIRGQFQRNDPDMLLTDDVIEEAITRAKSHPEGFRRGAWEEYRGGEIAERERFLRDNQAPDTTPPDPPGETVKPTEADYVKIVPALQRAGPDVLKAELEAYQKKFGSAELRKLAREQGFKKIPNNLADHLVVDKIIELSKAQIVDRAMAAGASPEAATWEAISSRMEAGWQRAAASMAEGKTPEAAIQDGILAAGRQAEPEAAPAPAKLPDGEQQSLIEKAAKKPEGEPVPQEILQELADALDEAPARAPGQARQIPPPKAMLGNYYHIAEYEGADGRQYRIMAAQENGLGPYRVIDVDGRKTVARDLGTLDDARSAIPGAGKPYAPGIAAERAALQSPGMAPGPPPKVVAHDANGNPLEYRVRDWSVVVSNRTDYETFLQVRGKDGEAVGYAEIQPSRYEGDDRWYISMMEMDKDHRNGMASYALLKAAEAELGGPILPDGKLLTGTWETLPDGSKKFWPGGWENWAGRLPWVKQWYRQLPGDSAYYSPRAILYDYGIAKLDLEEKIKNGASKAAVERSRKIVQGYEEVIASLDPESIKPENLREMFALRGETPSPGALKEEARADVMKILDRVLPTYVKREVANEIKSRVGANVIGSYDPIERLVKVALNSPNPRQIAWHEVVHALRTLGKNGASLFTEAEWNAMLRYADSVGTRKHFNFDQDYIDYYARQGASPQEIKTLIDEEVVAKTMDEFAKGLRVGGPVQYLFDRAILMFRSLKTALGMSKWNTPEKAFDSVFRRIRTGEIGQRAPKYDDTGLQFPMSSAPEMAAMDAGAKDVGAVYSFLDDSSLRAVTDEDVPLSAGFWRFDRAGVAGQDRNALVRLIGTNLLNDTVGKSDHSLNPFSVDLDQARIFNNYVGEYNRARKPAFDAWAEDLKLSYKDAWDRTDEFYEEVGLYVGNRRPDAEFHPAVKQLGDTVKKIQAEILKDMQNPMRREGWEQSRPLQGAERAQENLNYLWRKFDYDKVHSFVQAFGQPALTALVKAAIKKAQRDINEETLDKLAKGYSMGIYRRAMGYDDEWMTALAESDFVKFRQLLKDEASLTPDEIDDVIGRLGIEKPDGGSMSNLKKRTILDESADIEVDLRNGMADKKKVYFHDLLDNNIDRVFTHYARRVSGRLALGRMYIKAPRFGDNLVEGITNDAEWAQLMKVVKDYGTHQGVDPAITDKAIERLNFAYDRIKGVPQKEEMENYARWYRNIRSLNASRLMGQVGVAQLGESGTVVGTLGVSATMQHVPAMRRMVDEAGNSRLMAPLYDELEHIGIGVERLHGWGFHNLDQIGDVPFEVRRWDRGQAIDRTVKTMEKITYEASGMTVIQQQQERWAAASIAQKFANMAAKPTLSQSDLRRAAQLGLDDAMLQRIFKEMRQHVDVTDGILFGNKVQRLNLNNWTDLEARAAFENGMFRLVRKVIQTPDVGNTALWMSDPLWKTILQFRNFTFTAWANQFLYNVHMRDFNAFSSMLWSTAWAATVRGMQVQLLASTRSDGELWKEKQLDPWELGKAGFSRAGWSSIIPMIVDTSVVFAGQPGQFNARTTGQPSDIMFGSPVTSLVDSAMNGIRGTANSILTGRALSQAEARQLAGILPFSNLLPMTMGLSHLIQDMPERAPKKLPQF